MDHYYHITYLIGDLYSYCTVQQSCLAEIVIVILTRLLVFSLVQMPGQLHTGIRSFMVGVEALTQFWCLVYQWLRLDHSVVSVVR